MSNVGTICIRLGGHFDADVGHRYFYYDDDYNNRNGTNGTNTNTGTGTCAA